MPDDGCETVTRDPRIVLEERNSKIVFRNEQRQSVRKIHIDGCRIKDNGLRCDYLLIVVSGTEYYVELKGGDVDHAVRQLERTIQMVSQDRRALLKHCFVISTRCPIQTPKIQQLQLKFKREYNSTLKIKNVSHTEDI